MLCPYVRVAVLGMCYEICAHMADAFGIYHVAAFQIDGGLHFLSLTHSISAQHLSGCLHALMRAETHKRHAAGVHIHMY